MKQKHQIRPNINDIIRALPLTTRVLVARNAEVKQGKFKSHPKIKEVCHQLFASGYTYREIAGVLYVSKATVYLWLKEKRLLDAQAKAIPPSTPAQAEASITMIDKRGIFQRIFDWFR